VNTLQQSNSQLISSIDLLLQKYKSYYYHISRPCGPGANKHTSY